MLNFTDIDGNPAFVAFPQRGGTYEAHLQPLSNLEMESWKARFEREAGGPLRIALAGDAHKDLPTVGTATAVTRSQTRTSLAPETEVTEPPAPETEATGPQLSVARLLHVRYGHASPKRLSEAISSGMSSGRYGTGPGPPSPKPSSNMCWHNAFGTRCSTSVGLPGVPLRDRPQPLRESPKHMAHPRV